MAESKNRFTRYFQPLLDALRSTHPGTMRPAEARAWIRARVEVPEEDLTRRIANSKQSIFENDVYWAKFYLSKSKYVHAPQRGQWAVTDQGLSGDLTSEDKLSILSQVREAVGSGVTNDEENAQALESLEGECEADSFSYWFVGSVWNQGEDQIERFKREGIWENGYEDQFSELVASMRPGDRIAVKATFVKRIGLPFNVGGKPVSVMRIKLTGTVIENLGDGRKVRVDWDGNSTPRDWYFYTYRTTIVEANVVYEEAARRLVEFTFFGGPQDYEWFLQRPYWMEKYGVKEQLSKPNPPSIEQYFEPDDVEEPVYSVEDVVKEGCFLSNEDLGSIMERWRMKKNLLLQGPPGTGKTWLAKRLGFALIGSSDREATRTRLRIVQFHASLTYEDFVRGWRPTGEGKLELADGILMQAIDAAKSEPDLPFVLVIEEINRGNPAQIFGEMLTLLENNKRHPAEAMELAYRRSAGERVYVPENLYVIGTMNVADRSLAMVDLALRRRFAFVDLRPRLGDAWRTWCMGRGLTEGMLAQIAERISSLNHEIAMTPSLGEQFRVGHSFVTPDMTDHVHDGAAWFRARVETEIGPLLDEYFHDSPERAREARKKLLSGL